VLISVVRNDKSLFCDNCVLSFWDVSVRYFMICSEHVLTVFLGCILGLYLQNFRMCLKDESLECGLEVVSLFDWNGIEHVIRLSLVTRVLL
jgi:hypothetical protein